MQVFAECSVCRQPLPVGAPVAFMDKQQVIHVRCFPAPAPRPSRPRRLTRTAPPTARPRDGVSL